METFDKIWKFLGKINGPIGAIAGGIAIIGAIISVVFYLNTPPADPDQQLLEKIRLELKDTQGLKEADIRDLKSMRLFLKQKSIAKLKEEALAQGFQPDVQTEENRETALTEIAEQGNEEQLQALTEFTKGDVTAGLDTLIAEAEKASENLAAKWRQIGELAYGVNVGDALHAYKKVIALAPEESIWDHIYLARLYVLSGQLEQARQTIKQAFPLAVDNSRDAGVLSHEIGYILTYLGNLDSALNHFKNYQLIANKMAKADPTNSQAQRDLSFSFNRIGDIHKAQGNLDEALANFQEGLEIRKKLAELDPTNSQAQRDLSVSYEKIGDIHQAKGNQDKALANFQDALEIRKKLAELDPTNSQVQRDIGVSLAKLARHPQGEVTWQQVYEHFKAMDDKGVLAPADSWMVEASFNRAQKETAAQ